MLQNSLPNIFDSSFPDGAFGGGAVGRNEVNMWSFFLFFSEGDEDGDEEGAEPSDGEDREATTSATAATVATALRRGGDGSGSINVRGAQNHRSSATAEPRIVRLSDVAF